MTRIVDMMDVTRLTRAGRLGDALAVLRGGRPSPSVAAVTRDPEPGAATEPLLDCPAKAKPNPALPSSPQNAREAPSGSGAMPLPKSLRTLLDRVKQLQPALGLKGLSGLTTSEAPASLPQGARFETRSFTNAAGSRAYKLYVPSNYKGQTLPLVVMLHGCTQSPDDFAAGTRMNDLAEEHLFLVAYPAQSQSANPSKCWNWFNASDQMRDQGEPSLVAGITREIMREFPVSTRSVYVAGLSAGGAAAATMGSTYPDLYAAVGVHSGLACGVARDIPSAFAAMKQGASPTRQVPPRQGASVPTIVFHGDRDTTVNPVNADDVIAQAGAATNLRRTVSQGVAGGGMRFTRTVHDSHDGRTILEQWVVHGAGHAWSGGSSDGSYTSPHGPDASREMVRFFLATSRMT